MTSRGCGFRPLAALLMAAALAIAGCSTTPPEGEKAKPKAEPTGPHASLLKLFPAGQDLTDWKAAGDVKVFGLAADPAQGVEAIDADLGSEAAAVRGYDYAKSGTRKYTRGTAGETVTLRVFEMKSPSEAFGLFSVRSSGTQYPLVGLAARMSNTALGMVKGQYYAAVEYSGTNDATPVLMEFSRWVADQVTSPGYRPSLVESFPQGSAQGERYFMHRFETLAALPFVPKGDAAAMARALSLTPDTDVAVLGYPTDKPGELNYVFVIRYPSEGDASAAYAAYDNYLQNSTNPAEHNVAVAPPVRSYLAGTLNAEENSVKDVLAKVLAALGS